MNNDPKDFGFREVGGKNSAEFQSSINIDISNTRLDIEEIAKDVARNLTYRAKQLLQEYIETDTPLSYVLTLTVAPGKAVHSSMSIHAEMDSRDAA